MTSQDPTPTISTDIDEASSAAGSTIITRHRASLNRMSNEKERQTHKVPDTPSRSTLRRWNVPSTPISKAAAIPEARPALADGEAAPRAEDFEGEALEAFFEQEEEYLAAEGRAIFQAVCTSCHVVREDPNDADGEPYEYGQPFENEVWFRGGQ